jgi:nucleotide-binding universal stress UspA family protein
VGEPDRDPKEGPMAKRILVVITPETTGDLRSAARSAGLVARDSGGQVRMVFVRPIPPPRMDRYDRLVADPDAEMVRLTGLSEIRMTALGPEFGDIPIESLVRFGRLAAELRIEAETFGADLIGLAGPARPGLRHQLRAWYLGLALPAPVVLLPLTSDDAAGPRRESLVLPAFR